ncbi:MAG: 5-dehydro-4-deoxy-D-glucuronate isomerase [Clostridia bacterium]|nr:5-dehydro-4-deoxy-D-glucuronate isomerase [Clostridia bacterium]
MKLDIRYPSHPQDAKWYDTEKLRRQYLIEKVFEKDEALLTYSHFDRIIAGGIMPVDTKVALTGGKELASQYFLERREMGIINVGGPGRVYADSDTYELAPRDGLYLGMSIKTLEFESLDPANPAKYWINSCPAHQTYPNKKINIKDAAKRPLGSVETCNKRVINQYIHPAVLKTCQLCMGLTELEPGSNWNSMPCHTHERRMEVYFYFNLGDNIMFHMMGQPQETRHIIMHDEQAVISPSWSIHCGVGTSSYAFIWGMCGENQEFDDMDNINPKDMM